MIARRRSARRRQDARVMSSKPGIVARGSRSPRLKTVGGGPPGAAHRSTRALSASSLGFVLAHSYDYHKLLESAEDVDIVKNVKKLSRKLDAILGDAAVLQSAAAISSTCRVARAGCQPSLALRGTERMRAGVNRLVAGKESLPRKEPRPKDLRFLRAAFASPALREASEELKARVAKPLLSIVLLTSGGELSGNSRAALDIRLRRLEALRVVRAVHDAPGDPSISRAILKDLLAHFLSASGSRRLFFWSYCFQLTADEELESPRPYIANIASTNTVKYVGFGMNAEHRECVECALLDLMYLLPLAFIQESKTKPCIAPASFTEICALVDVGLTFKPIKTRTGDIFRGTIETLAHLSRTHHLERVDRNCLVSEGVFRDLVRGLDLSDNLDIDIPGVQSLNGFLGPLAGISVSPICTRVAILLLEAGLMSITVLHDGKTHVGLDPDLPLETLEDVDFMRLQLGISWAEDLDVAKTEDGIALSNKLNGLLQSTAGHVNLRVAQLWLAYMDRLSGTTVSDAHERLYERVANIFISNFRTLLSDAPDLIMLEEGAFLQSTHLVLLHSLSGCQVVADVVYLMGLVTGNWAAQPSTDFAPVTDMTRLLWGCHRAMRMNFEDGYRYVSWRVVAVTTMLCGFAVQFPKAFKKLDGKITKFYLEIAGAFMQALNTDLPKPVLHILVEALGSIMICDQPRSDDEESPFPESYGENILDLLSRTESLEMTSTRADLLNFDYETQADLLGEGDCVQIRDVAVHILAHQVLCAEDDGHGVLNYYLGDFDWFHAMAHEQEVVDALLALLKAQRPSSRLAALELLLVIARYMDGEWNMEYDGDWSWEDGDEPPCMSLARTIFHEEIASMAPRIKARDPKAHLARCFLGIMCCDEEFNSPGDVLESKLRHIAQTGLEAREKILARKASKVAKSDGDPSRTAESAAAAEEALLEMLDDEEQEASKKQKKKQKKKAKKKAAAPVAAPAPPPAPPPAPASPAASSPDAESSASDDDDDLARLLPTRQPSAVQRPKRVAPVAPPAPRPAPAAPRPPPPPQPPKPAAVPRPEPPPSTLEQLLSRLKLGRYGKNFAAAEVTLDLLPLLTLEDYADVGLSRQDALKVRDAIAPPAPPPAPPAPAPQGDRHSGKIRSWTQGDNYGFITPAGAGKAIFCHGSGLKGDIWTTPWKSVGARVTYLVGERRGRPIAVDVRFAGEAIPPPPARPAPPPRDDDVPEEFLCPITFDLMTDPVIAADGHTYERRAIEAWFSRARTSPVTNEPLEHLHLIPAHTIRSLIQRRFEAP